MEKLQYITDDTDHEKLLVSVEQACLHGIRWVQLRLKNAATEERVAVGKKLKDICTSFNTVLIINDDVEAAKILDCHGVHLGKEDTDPALARKILGASKIIGGTANTFDDVKSLHKAGVNYIGLGPYAFTPTKEKLSPILGETGYKNIIHQMNTTKIKTPVYAIGGIKKENVTQIMSTGVYGIAVSSAIRSSADTESTIKEFNRLING